MNRYDYTPGRKLSQHAFQVREVRGRFVVLGPYGGFAEWFSNADDANDRAVQAEAHYRQSEALATGQASPASPQSTVQSPASPMAFEPFDLGGGGGFGVFDENGNPSPKFYATRAEALKYAAVLKAAFQASAQGTGTPGRSIPAAAAQAASRANPGGAASAGSSRAVPLPTGFAQASTFSTPPTGSTVNPTTALGGVASASPGSATRSATGRGPLADAFERAFDASIGKAIAGAEKIVTGSLTAFRSGFSTVKSAIANPGQGAAAFGSSVKAARQNNLPVCYFGRMV